MRSSSLSALPISFVDLRNIPRTLYEFLGVAWLCKSLSSCGSTRALQACEVGCKVPANERGFGVELLGVGSSCDP